MIGWCRNNGVDFLRRQIAEVEESVSKRTTLEWTFKREEDATAFKLCWQEYIV